MTSAIKSITVPLKMNQLIFKKPLMVERSGIFDLIRQNNFDVKTAKSMAKTIKKIYKMEFN